MRCLSDYLFLAPYPPYPPLRLYVVCCDVHILLQNSVCARGGGGGHLRVHVSSVLVAMSVCVMHPPTHCVNLCFYVLPIRPLQARTISVLGYNHSRLERSS